MNEETLSKILKFNGDIRSAYNLLKGVYNDLGFVLKTDLSAISTHEQTFGNVVRNYRSKGLISPVKKSGIKLILDGRNLLQYLLVQRFLAISARIAQLIDIVPNLENNQLIKLILKETLSLTDLPGLTENQNKKLPTTDSTVSSSVPVWYHIKVDQGIQLQINANQYSVDDVEKIRSVLRSALDELE